jgi:CRISPR-associated protein Csh1
MIEAIRNIGEYALRKNEKSIDEPLEILLDNPANKNSKGVLFILLDDKDEEFQYLMYID